MVAGDSCGIAMGVHVKKIINRKGRQGREGKSK